MPKLTDTQLVILSAATGRKDRAVLPLSKSLKMNGVTATKTLQDLCKIGLLEEKPAARDAAAWREGNDGRRTMLAITAAGLAALDGEPVSDAKTLASGRTKKRRSGARPKAPASKTHDGAAPPTVRAGTKQALLIDLLTRKTGATIAEAVEALGWQAHSIRGAISGALKKKLGFAIWSESVDGRGRVYRIAQ